ncbi:MAG: hypothetical protein R3B09_35540 [Nannocystaceae bacterium]
MLQRLVPVALALALPLTLSACGGKGDKDKKEADKGAEEKDKGGEPEQKRDPSTSLDKVSEGPDVSGPVPPEVSMVFFTVDGALTPVGCWDKDKGKMHAGKECHALVPKGSEVYLKSDYAVKVDALGESKGALCEVAVDHPISFGTAATDGGATFDYATFPKSAGPKVGLISADTWGDGTRRFSDPEKGAVVAAVKAAESKVGDLDVIIHQAAGLDLDGDGKEERFFSAYVINPKDIERYLFSGLFMARGGDVSRLILVDKDKSSSQIYKLRAGADLDGDGVRELWLSTATSEGGGDRMYHLKGEAFEGLGKWTCGM